MMLTGFGMLRADGVDAGRVEYKIMVRESRGMKRADGHLWGNARAMFQAFEARDTTLVREDIGYEMRIVITHLSGDGEAQISVSGPPWPI